MVCTFIDESTVTLTANPPDDQSNDESISDTEGKREFRKPDYEIHQNITPGPTLLMTAPS